MLTLCEVAALARDVVAESSRPGSFKRSMTVSQFGLTREEFDGMLRSSDHDDDGSAKCAPNESGYQGGLIIDPAFTQIRRGAQNHSQKAKVTELLGAWYVALGRVGF